MTGPGKQQHRMRGERNQQAILLLAASVLLCWALVTPLMAEGIRIGYVDMKRLFDTMPQLVAAREEIDREFRPRNEALLADETELERMRRDLADDLLVDEQARLQREREISNMRRSIERRREDLVEEMRFQINSRREAIEDTVEVAVREIARENDYDLVLSNPVAYASETVDITDLVLEWLEADFRSGENHREP
jgi:outer membrane protein